MLQKKIKLLIYLLLFACIVQAQKFTEKANLAPVTATGFYSIPVNPQLSSNATLSFSDVRVADNDNNFVPYIITSQKPSFTTSNYNKLPVIKNELTDSGKSELIIQNRVNQKIASVALLIRNAAVNRYATISGSDDMKKWFTIDENINLENITGNDTDRYVQTIDFPVSSYRYFKIVIDNKKNNPLNIIEAGSYSNVKHTADAYIANPAPAFIQTDGADKYSYIIVHQNAAYHIDKINLQIESPKFFERDIYTINSFGISQFKISSNNVLNISPAAFNDKDWSIRIYNGDNPPLKIKAITLQQESKNIVTYLQAGKTYHLLMHDSTVATPVYDLQKFEDSIPAVIPRLKITSFKDISGNNATVKSHFAISSTWLWILILAILAALGFITYKLMNEVKNKNTCK